MTAVLATTLATGLAFGATLHEQPLGVVDRQVQVTVYPERLTVDYRLGLGESSMRAALRRLGIPYPSGKAAETYRSTIAGRLPRFLTIRVNGAAVPLRLVEVAASSRHHVAAEIRYEGEFAAAGPLTVEVADENYRLVAGDHRVALRGRGGVRVTDSDGPELLVRAEPVRMEGLSRLQRDRQRCRRAVLDVVSRNQGYRLCARRTRPRPKRSSNRPQSNRPQSSLRPTTRRQPTPNNDSRD